MRGRSGVILSFALALVLMGELSLPFPVCAQARAANPAALKLLQSQHLELRNKYFAELQRLIDEARSAGDAARESEIAGYLRVPDGQRIELASLPKTVLPSIPLNEAGQERTWQVELQYQRKEYARQLYLLSRRALHAGFPAYAYDLIHELVIHDPDHPKGRELLGYVRLGDEWMTPFAKKMRTEGYEWSEQFGWLPQSHVKRYLAGERNVDGRWMSAEKEASLRQDFEHAWEIRTDHYLIRTNYSLERGVELGEALEDFHEFFHQTFAGFFNEPEQLQKVFDTPSRNPQRNLRPYLVNYYRSRQEYIERLEPVFPAIQATNGIYLTGDRTAHFYYDPKGATEDTLFHEATHQLFYQSQLQNRPIADQAHFWVVEGIACYLESFRRQDGAFSVGDPGHIRFAGARMNYIDKQYYVPLADFAAMGSNRFQAAPMAVLAKNYTQAAGMAHFFMQYDGGRYRDAIVSHLAQIYSGNSRKRQYAQGLDELTGVPYSELDQQYGEWLMELRKREQAAAQAQVPP